MLARRLAAVVAMDVVGYSRLMGVDEAGTLAALQTHWQELLTPKSAQYNGRTVKLMGDGALMDFGSVVDATSFAVEVQIAMQQRNRDVPQDRRIVFRIGINLGDIIVQDDDIFGDGVNVAARLEGLADPGGICLSRSARDQVRDKLELELEDLEEIEVKNIARPIRVFRVILDEKASLLATPVSTNPKPDKIQQRIPFLAAMVVGIGLLVGFVWWRPWVAVVEPDANAEAALPLPDKPSIAVLPFDNLSDDPKQAYFADGLTQDLITNLSFYRELFVIARNSTFAYKDRAVDVKQVGRDLGVAFVVEGSVRRENNRVRISAQLIDARTGSHVWAERFDRELSDIL